jgi:hypothetical protein
MIYSITLSARRAARRHFEAERFRSLEVDHQLGFCLLLDRGQPASRPENATTAGQHFRRIAESMPTR